MDEIQSRTAVSDRILNDLRNIVKQIYYDSVNELNSNNKTYLCMTLIKVLDEALSHGLKQLHLGYWRAVKSVLHPETLSQLAKLPKYNGLECNNLTRGRAWLALALNEDCLVNYVHCVIRETCVNKYYERWSIVRNNDMCNKFLSILTGLDNINFAFQIDFINKPPSYYDFSAKALPKEEEATNRESNNLSSSKTSINLTASSSSSLTSPVDSGVHIPDSSSSSSDAEHLPTCDKSRDMDYLNGNVPDGTVTRRKNKKDAKRHVSFHEDIICKSPDKCRKLRWDCENLRYSWSGEEIDASLLADVDFGEMKSQVAAAAATASKAANAPDITERGAPEGEETPCNVENVKQMCKAQKSVIVKRFLQSIGKQSRIRQLSKRYGGGGSSSPHRFFDVRVDADAVDRVNSEIRTECEAHWRRAPSRHDVALNMDMIGRMIGRESAYRAYRLRDYLFVITNASVYVVNRALETRRIPLDSLTDVVIYPDSHVFWLWESRNVSHEFVTGNGELTHEIMGRLELAMRRSRMSPPRFRVLRHDDLAFLKRRLLERRALDKGDNLVYCGVIKLEKEVVEPCGPSTKRGFLMYRDRRTGDNWMPGDFLLKGNVLYLFADGLKQPKLAMNLFSSCQSCSRTTDSGRPHTFQITIADEEAESRDGEATRGRVRDEKSIKSKLLMGRETQRILAGLRSRLSQLLTFGGGGGGDGDGSCVMEFAAANECEVSEWLQMIIQASCGDSGEDVSRGNVVEAALLLTDKSLIITKELFASGGGGDDDDGDVHVLSCAQIRDVESIRIGRDANDLFALIEFSCMEAAVTSGDWVIFASSRGEVEKLDATLRKLWRSNREYPGEYLTEERLIDKCRKTQANLREGHWWTLLATE